MTFMQARSHPNSRNRSQRKRFDGWRHIELNADDRKRGCMFSINLIFSVHTYALLTKRVPSIWLGIGQFLQRFLWTEMRTRLIKSNNKRRARPISKRVIFFPSSNNGVSLPLANSTIWQITMYYRIQMICWPNRRSVSCRLELQELSAGLLKVDELWCPTKIVQVVFCLQIWLGVLFLQYHKSIS